MDDSPITIQAASRAIRDRTLTPVQLLERCLAAWVRLEPRVQAWVHLDENRARAEAEALTRELDSGKPRGPLHGIPVGIKDIIDVQDMPTGCGSQLWANSLARQDAEVVRQLRAAGAIILGKTVTTPYAYLDPPRTRNPWHAERTPGGSSSGSAAAVAMGSCLAALGTQTGGSVTRPASYCGVASYKPRHGQLSTAGVLPLAPSLDHIGLMARTVADLVIVFHALTGQDLTPRPDAPADPSLHLIRLGGYFDELLAEEARPLYEQALQRIAGSGLPVSTQELPGSFTRVPAAHRLLMAAEAAEVHGQRLQRLPDEYPVEIRKLVDDGLAAQAEEIRASRNFREQIRSTMAAQLPAGACFITPATTGFAPDPRTTGNPACNSPWSYLGWPTLSVPVGWSAEGLPFAVQLVAKPGADHTLFAIAERVESAVAFPARVPE